MCQAIASPSRSGSVANIIFFASRVILRKCSIAFLFALGITYSGSKFLSTSTPSFALGRSRTWPMLASILYPDPRNRVSVFAFVGDSTITKVSGMFLTMIADNAKMKKDTFAKGRKCLVVSALLRLC